MFEALLNKFSYTTCDGSTGMVELEFCNYEEYAEFCIFIEDLLIGFRQYKQYDLKVIIKDVEISESVLNHEDCFNYEFSLNGVVMNVKFLQLPSGMLKTLEYYNDDELKAAAKELIELANKPLK